MKTSDLKNALDQRVSSTEWTNDNTWNVLNQVRKEKASPKHIRIPAGLTVAAALVVLCVGILAGTGKLNIFGHPDQIGGQYTAQPMEVPLAQGGQVTVTEDGTADLVTPEPAAPETAAPAAPLDDWMLTEMKSYTPEVASRMKPLRLYEENRYGKVELVAGLLSGRDAWFVFSLVDPEAKVLRNSSTCVDLGFWLPNTDYSDGEGVIYSNNIKEHRTLQYRHLRYNGAAPSADSTISIQISNPEVETYETVGIPLSVLEQAKENKGADLPANVTDRTQGDAEAPSLPQKVLDDSQPMEYSLTENVVLTGAGWIDGWLHVRIHHLGKSRIEAGSGDYPAWHAEITCLVDRMLPDFFSVGWDDTGDEQEDWVEYAWKFSPEDLSQATLSASIMQASTPIPGTWYFQVPVSSILEGSGT
jgi:hypothetical protein